MAYLIPPLKRTRQPQRPAQIDWNNPLTRGLAFAQTGQIVPPWTNSGVGLEATADGLAAKFVRASTQYATTSITGIAAAPLTIACRYRLASTIANGSAYLPINLSRNADNTALCEIYMSRATDIDRVLVLSYNAGTSGQAEIITTHSTSSFANFAGIYSASNNRVAYLNGTVGTANTTNVSITNPLTNAYLGVEALAGSRSATTYFDGVIPHSAVWARALTVAELDEYFRNPWQIYASEPRRIFFGASGGTTAYNLDAQPGGYVVSGTAATLLRGIVLDAQPATYTVSGTAASIVRGYNLNAATGTFTATGAAATLLRGLSVNAAPGSFSVSGVDATLEYTQPGAYTLDAQPGSYSLTGVAATLTYTPLNAYTLDAQPASYVLTGAAATLTYAGASIWTDVGVTAATWSDVGAASSIWTDL